jgi:hypothetical protein
MTRELLLARLIAMRAVIDSWILETTESEALQCCDHPNYIETYGSEKHCTNCGTISKAGSDKVSGEQERS